MLGQIGLAGGGISYAHHYSSIGVSSSGAAMPGSFPSNLDEGQTAKYTNKDYQGYSEVIPVARTTDSLLHSGKTIDYNGRKLPMHRIKWRFSPVVTNGAASPI
ncbi:trimethylamine-n-oxide reductase [Actinobacillus equuli]|nr:trimethylamine-n-oxide reductase [Actinobacillus equuli]